MAFLLNYYGLKLAGLDYPVGRGAPNKRDDVMLVQALLTNCFVSSCADGSPLRPFYKKIQNVNFSKLTKSDWGAPDGLFGHQTATLLNDYVQFRGGGVAQTPRGWVLPWQVKRGTIGRDAVKRDSLMERLYKDGSTVAPYDTNFDVWDTLPTIDCYMFKAPALLHMALANVRQEPAKHWKEHHVRMHPAAKSMLIDL